MEEKIKNIENKDNELGEKLTWETPKLICLDKGKTEGGPRTGTTEDSTYDKAS